jgi:hypothetical protein
MAPLRNGQAFAGSGWPWSLAVADAPASPSDPAAVLTFSDAFKTPTLATSSSPSGRAPRWPTRRLAPPSRQ